MSSSLSARKSRTVAMVNTEMTVSRFGRLLGIVIFILPASLRLVVRICVLSTLLMNERAWREPVSELLLWSANRYHPASSCVYSCGVSKIARMREVVSECDGAY